MIRNAKKQILSIICIVIAMVPLTDASADIYNYIDQRGISNFSDQAFPAAKKIILEKPNLYHLNFSNSNPSNSNKAIYQSNHVSIISPADQQHFHNVDNVVVAITCQPALMNNQHIELWVDGGLYKESTRLQFSLLQLTRGEHKLEAKLTEQGKILATSAPVTIFMNQTITYNL